MNYTELAHMPEKAVLIYKIENTHGHAYVGSTVTPARRWASHQKMLRSGKHTSFVLQRSWDKHGEAEHKFEGLFVCPESQRFFYEHRAIAALGKFNLLKTPGQPPAGAMQGKKHTSQALANLSRAASARWAKEWALKYEPLCQKAWELVVQGTPKYKACKAVGVSHSTFWRWISLTGRKEAWNK
jgi:hypothetical protein